MQADAVNHYHWMTSGQFLNAVALGQVTPGPVVQTVAVVGYAAAGVGGGLLAARVAFSPSFAFVLLGAEPLRPAAREPERRRVPRRSRAGRDRGDPRRGGPARARPLGAVAVRGARRRRRCCCSSLRRGPVSTLLLAGAAGVIVALAGGRLPI